MSRAAHRRHRSIAGAALALLGVVVAGGAAAQDQDRPIAPLEVRTCSFVEGRGPADLDALRRDYVERLERSGAPPQSAFALQPLLHSDEIAHDVAWVVSWPDADTMGASLAHAAARGAESADAVLAAYLRCPDRKNFSVITLREPVDVDNPGPVEVATCTLRLGAVLDETLQAVAEWVDFTASTGSTAAHWLLFPAYGERSDAKYTFRWVVGFASYQAFGRDYDRFTNGDGAVEYNERFGLLMSCDNPRLYAARTMRAPP